MAQVGHGNFLSVFNMPQFAAWVNNGNLCLVSPLIEHEEFLTVRIQACGLTRTRLRVLQWDVPL